jgi:hypothetical protein
MLPIHPPSPKDLPHDARERDLLLDESLLPPSIPSFEKGLYDLNDANSADLYQLVGSPPATPSVPIVPVPSPIPTSTTSATFVPTRSTALTTVGAPRKYPSNNVPSTNVYRHGQVSLTPHGTLPQNVVQDLTLSMSNVADIPHTVTSVLSLDQVDPSAADNIDTTAAAKVQEAEAAPTTDGTVINPVISVPQGENYVDITEFMNLPQAEAAKKLGIPSSTLSKRWKEAVQKRKWPWRAVCKIYKEIMTLLHNVPQGHTGPLPEEMEGRLGKLLRKRQEELKPVVVRLS